MSWAAQHNQHQLLMFYEHHLSVSSHHMQQVLPGYACVDVLHMCALYLVPVHISHKVCVSIQDEVEVAKLESAACFTIN